MIKPRHDRQVMNTEALDKESKFEADVIVLGCKAWEVERCLGMCAPWCGKNTLVPWSEVKAEGDMTPDRTPRD